MAGPTRELTSSNLPLKGSKGSMYEGGLRVPFMMQWPGTIPAGQTYHKTISSLDIYATRHREQWHLRSQKHRGR